MSTEQKIGFGFQDDLDESLKAKGAGGKFGLNEKAVITKFEYNPNGGAGGAPGDVLDIAIQVGDREFRRRIFPIDKIFDRNGNEIQDQSSKEYIAGFNEQMKHFKAEMTHYLKLFRTEDQIKAAFATPPTSWIQYVTLCSSLMKDGIEQKVPVDVFLQWQWQIGSGQDQTYLELPKNLKDGAFITPHMAPVGSWKEARDEEGNLIYKDDAGNKHRFHRSKDYLESNKGNRQTLGDKSGGAMNQASQNAAKSVW